MKPKRTTTRTLLIVAGALMLAASGVCGALTSDTGLAEDSASGYGVSNIFTIDTRFMVSDVTTTAVTIPATGLSGVAVTIQWHVENLGPGPAEGAWFDGVYLSADQTWDLNDPVIARVPHTGPLAVGSGYDGSVTADLPGVPPGQYWVIVRADARDNLLEWNKANNVCVSGTGGGQSTVTTDIPELVPGVEQSGTPSTSTSRYYKVLASTADVIRVGLNSISQTGANELYVRKGALPDRTVYDFKHEGALVQDPQALVPGATLDWYYVLAYSASTPEGAASYTIKAELVQPQITGLTPSSGGNAGSATIHVAGSGFPINSTVTATLKQAGQPDLAAAEAGIASGSEVIASFGLTGAAPGLCDLTLTFGNGRVATKSGAFTIEQGGSAEMWVQINSETSFRPGRTQVFTVEYGNSGTLDAIGIPLWVAGLPPGSTVQVVTPLVHPALPEGEP